MAKATSSASRIRPLIKKKEPVKATRSLSLDSTDSTHSVDSETIGTVERNQRFPIQFSYTHDQNSALRIIPSNWRSSTHLGSTEQGDHVTAYVLLLKIFFNLEGEHIRSIPKKFITNIVNTILPEKKELFIELANKAIKKMTIAQKKRREFITTLAKDDPYTKEINNSMRANEYHTSIGYLQEAAEKLITEINSLKEESFPAIRKENTLEIKKLEISEQVRSKIDGIKYKEFQDILLKEIAKSKKLTDKDIDETSKKIIINSKDIDIPDFLTNDNGEIGIGKLNEFIKSLVPLKKQDEKGAIAKLEEIESQIIEKRKIDPKKIGQSCAMLYDYPKVGNDPKTKKPCDDLDVLCKTMARHIIITFTAFKPLQTLPQKDKEQIFNVFVGQIFEKQLWKLHKIEDKKGKETPLTLDLLKAGIREFAELDFKDNKLRMYTETEREHMRIIEEAAKKAEDDKVNSKVIEAKAEKASGSKVRRA